MSDFITFARAHGVEINPSQLYPSERIKRCGTVDKPRSGNGAYFWNGERGWVMDWSGEAKVIWFEDPHAKPWTDDEKRAWMEKRRAAATDQDKKYEEAAKRAQVMLDKAKPATHPYLEIKGLKEEKGLVLDEVLLVPMRNVVTNKLQGLQQIWWNLEERKYEKKMLTGMRAKNAVAYLGPRENEEFWLVEGYATGLSLHLSLKRAGIQATVVVAFSASNLIQVADQISGKRFIFADNDESLVGENSAKTTGLPYTMTDEVGWDANDLYMKKGQFAVLQKVALLRNSV